MEEQLALAREAVWKLGVPNRSRLVNLSRL
jgi:hypothetical protein